MKNKLSFVVFLFLLISISMNSVEADPAPPADFITIYTTVFHPGPSVDASKTVEWDFNADGLVDSTQIDGSYVFPGPGSYSVKLKVKDAVSETITTKTITISESLLPVTPVIPANWMNQAWSNRIKITVKGAKVTGDLSDFPVYLDLGILPSEFFNKVKLAGADIRITKADGKTELVREIVSVDKVNKTGELHFKADVLKTGVDNDFYIYFGNANATETGGQNVWTNGYAGVWHLHNDPSSATISDSSSNNNSGTSAGAMTASDLVTGKVGKALDFDGINDLIDFGANSSLNLTTNLSVEIWVNGAATNQKNILGKMDTTNIATSWGENSDQNNGSQGHDWKVSATAVHASSTGKVYRGGTVWDGTWHYIVMTFTNNSLKVYNQGVDITSTLQKVWDGTVNNLYSSASSLKLGSIGSNLSPIFKADELRISNVVRSSAWISTAYNNQSDNTSFFAIASNEDIASTPTPQPQIPSNWMNSAWKERIKLTIASGKVSENLVNFPIYIKLANLGDPFFSKVNSACNDVRVTDSTGTVELPREIVSCNSSSKTGELYFRANSLATVGANDFYIYFGNPNASNYSHTDQYGTENVWDDNYKLVAHLQANTGALLNSANTNFSGTVQGTTGISTSPSGNAITLPSGANSYLSFSDPSLNLSNNFTAALLFKTSVASSGGKQLIHWGGYTGGASRRALIINHLNVLGYSPMGNDFGATSNVTDNAWRYGAVTIASDNQGSIYVNANKEATGTPSASNYTYTKTTIGSSNQPHEFYYGDVDEIRISNIVRSSGWLKAEYDNLINQTNFYTITETNSIADGSASPAPSPAIPSNWLNSAWTARVKLTVPSAKVTEDLTDFPVYIKLADLGTDFFAKLNANCGDIRVTDSTGMTELAREIVSCNPTAKTGELHFKASSLKASSNNDFYIYYANPAAVNYDNTATYGRNKVWTSDFELVAHFEENPSTTLFVNSTGGVSGVYTNLGGLGTASGSLGNSLDCSATSPVGYVDLDSFSASPNRNFAFSAFVNFSNTGTPQVFFEYASPGGLNTRRVAAMFNPGKINWNHNNYDGNVELSTTLSPGTWYHMSVNSLEEDSAHSKLSTWLDGVANSFKTGYDSDNITANLGVICANRLFGESYNGKIDELRFYKNFKSNAWMIAEDSNLRSPSTFYTVGTKEAI